MFQGVSVRRAERLIRIVQALREAAPGAVTAHDMGKCFEVSERTIYRDIAAFRLVSQGADAIPADIRADLIDRISAPGAPLRLLGLEQSALFELEQGNMDAAVEILQGLVQEEGLTEAMLQRSAQLLAVLGADASSAIAQ